MSNILSLGRPTEYRHNFDIRYTLPINKIPLLSWVNTNINYDASYDWRASSLSASSFGNTIQNTNSIKINTQISLSSLYNKVPFLKNYYPQALIVEGLLVTDLDLKIVRKKMMKKMIKRKKKEKFRIIKNTTNICC